MIKDSCQVDITNKKRKKTLSYTESLSDIMICIYFCCIYFKTIHIMCFWYKVKTKNFSANI